ncbi:hypothetical protein K2173_011951 [Erythroxylum novogranatense]|uniref:Uncharacterized protein n=1 Tax=Erythroxylum novogranatense TaxID=1862640 RepID=A0AAV8U9L6_9ROSI|nr:hypothetical protein K2173_011951 [Erythroxylum novogranatense]
MDDSAKKVGPKGLIKTHEFIRIIIQSLYSLGYRKSALCLESESGISCKSMDLELLESQVAEGNWDGCINTLSAREDFPGETRASAMFLVFKQCLLEYLICGEDSLALTVLRKRVPLFRLGRENMHDLAFSILCWKDVEVDKKDDSIQEMRKRLSTELVKLLPPPIVLPEKRLEHLVETVVIPQIESCLYHNSMDAISLCEDHCCTRDQLPCETAQILTEHKDEVWFVQFSNNGEYLASSSSDCTAIIWKLTEGGRLIYRHTLRSHQKPVSFVSWSPDDRKLLTCGNGEVLKLWDVETGRCKRTFGDNGFIVSSCAWFPDSKQFVCGSCDAQKCICIWDCDGNERRAWRGKRIPKVLDLAVTADGKNLIGISDKEILILNLVTNAEKVIREPHSITSLSVSSDNKSFIVNLNSQEIHLWDVAGKWEEPRKYVGHKQQKYVIRSCFGGLNSSFIASGSENSLVYIWNRRNSSPIEVLSGHLMTVNSVSWNPRRHQMLASASDDHTIRIWVPRNVQHDKLS